MMTKLYTRYRPNRLGSGGGHYLKIRGERINIHIARLMYRCEVCFSKLERVDFGLKCKANRGHKGIVHQREIEQLKNKQAENVNQLNQFYEVRDGKVKIK